VSRPHRLRGLALAALVLAGAGCSASGGTEGAGPEPAAFPRQPAPSAPAPAGATRPLPPAPPLPAAAPDLPPPTGLTIESLGVAGAPVVPVGVEPDGDMEIPGPQEVGWYRYGPRPGDGGSAVLAAHIAYDGVDGVFRHLDDVRPGAAVTVDLGDGAARDFVVTAVGRYPKEALPDEVFARGGDAGLVLITCGGRFDSAARSYEDNVVAYARPA
jgi:hypothetical protein